MKYNIVSKLHTGAHEEDKDAEEDDDNTTRHWNQYSEYDGHRRVIRRVGLQERLRGGQSARHGIAVGARARVRIVGALTRAVGARRTSNSGAVIVIYTHKQTTSDGNECKVLR